MLLQVQIELAPKFPSTRKQVMGKVEDDLDVEFLALSLLQCDLSNDDLGVYSGRLRFVSSVVKRAASQQIHRLFFNRRSESRRLIRAVASRASFGTFVPHVQDDLAEEASSRAAFETVNGTYVPTTRAELAEQFRIDRPVDGAFSGGPVFYRGALVGITSISTETDPNEPELVGDTPNASASAAGATAEFSPTTPPPLIHASKPRSRERTARCNS